MSIDESGEELSEKLGVDEEIIFLITCDFRYVRPYEEGFEVQIGIVFLTNKELILLDGGLSHLDKKEKLADGSVSVAAVLAQDNTIVSGESHLSGAVLVREALSGPTAMRQPSTDAESVEHQGPIIFARRRVARVLIDRKISACGQLRQLVIRIRGIEWIG